MKIAIMQPYFFPYIGYWQLINMVDAFVIYDDVNYIKKGFINRNYLLQNQKAQLFTLELIAASQNKNINEIFIGSNTSKILKTIKHNYTKAPYFDIVYPLIENIFCSNEKNLSQFLGNSLQQISKYLEINTKFLYSSNINNDKSLQAQDRLIEISQLLGATDYVNTIGGAELYNKVDFRKAGIHLSFIHTANIEYKQYKNEFVQNLSIIDVMMFNSKEEIKQMLNQFELI